MAEAVLVSESTKSQSYRRGAITMGALLTALALALMPVDGAVGATIINGPIDLGTAESFALLGGSEITNTGPSVLDGDVGLHPGTAIGVDAANLVPGHGNDIYATDGVALQAKTDLRTAMTTAGGLTPTVSGLASLTSMELGPGVYAGGALSIAGGGVLTLVGDASSVWVFTAASTLITGVSSRIELSGIGASACNVFWLVGSSATFGTGTSFIGTVMAEQSITATTDTTVTGRLLASNAAVTLDSTDIVVPAACSPPGTTSTTGEPEFTSGLPGDATVGEPYSHDFDATGDATITYTVTDGTLPDGLVLDSTSGVLSGTPVDEGVHTFTVTASNGSARTASVIATIVALPAAVPEIPVVVVAAAVLPPTGVEPGDVFVPLVMIATGALLAYAGTRRRVARRH